MKERTAVLSLLRLRKPHEHARVTFVELFFDLVFVFAVTQISHTLLAHLTPLGVLQTAVLFLGVWWAWIYTSWITNWLDPDRTSVRVALFVLMLAGLVLSTSIPQAFAERGLAFALAYVAIQVGRTLFMLWAVPRSEVALSRNFARILAWLSASGLLWIAGGLAEGGVRLGLWGCAVAIEYAGPLSRFWTPGLGASTLQDWTIEGGHMAERCALFIIIALGESILVTGATFGEMQWSAGVLAAFLVAFIGSLAMWWVYFHKGAEAGAEAISHADDPGRLARLGYTYLHMPIVAGIIIAAAGDEIVLTHPNGHADLPAVFALVGGPLLFLVGTLLFKRTIHGLLQLSHLAGIAALVALAPLGHLLSPLALSAATSTVMVVVAVWEARSIGASVPARASARAKRVD